MNWPYPGLRGQWELFLPLRACWMKAQTASCLPYSLEGTQMLKVVLAYLRAFWEVGRVVLNPLSTSILSGELVKFQGAEPFSIHRSLTAHFERIFYWIKVIVLVSLCPSYKKVTPYIVLYFGCEMPPKGQW